MSSDLPFWDLLHAWWNRLNNHHTRHEPGGADPVTGTPPGVHASRHDKGGADDLTVLIDDLYLGLEFPKSKSLFYDDFFGRLLRDEWLLTVTGTGAGALQDGLNGGVYRLSAPTNATLDDATLDWNTLRTLTVAKEVVIEGRMRINSASNILVALLLFDDWNNTIYFRYHTAADATWRLSTISGGGGTDIYTGIAPDTNWHILRIECHTHGSNHVHFYIDGAECPNSPITTNVPTSYLQPRLLVATLTTAEKQLDIDYVVVEQER